MCRKHIDGSIHIDRELLSVTPATSSTRQILSRLTADTTSTIIHRSSGNSSSLIPSDLIGSG